MKALTRNASPALARVISQRAHIKPAPRKKGPIKKPPDKPLPMPDASA
jgi:hypothetical protein